MFFLEHRDGHVSQITTDLIQLDRKKKGIKEADL